MFVLYTMHSDSLTDVGTIRVFYLLTYLLVQVQKHRRQASNSVVVFR